MALGSVAPLGEALADDDEDDSFYETYDDNWDADIKADEDENE